MTRLWSIHPSYLDQKALQACWREGLGAQKAIKANLSQDKCGYQHHSALTRFMAADDPLAAIGWFLASIQDEATRRGYNYNRSLILKSDKSVKMNVTLMQQWYEWWHLGQKLVEREEKYRDSAHYAEKFFGSGPVINPMFHIIPGQVEGWEKLKCGCVIHYPLGEKRCERETHLFFDWGDLTGYPVCEVCASVMHPSRVEQVQEE